MRKLVRKLGIIVLSLIAIHLLMISLFFLVARNGELYEVYEKLETNQGKNPKYLVIGDSHAYQLKDEYAKQLDILNLSVRGTNYVQFYSIYKASVENNIKTDYLILPIDPNAFAKGQYRSFESNDYFWVNFVNYSELEREGIVYKDKKFNFTQKYFMGKYFPYAFNSGFWLNYLKQQESDDSEAREDWENIILPKRGLDTYNDEFFKRYFYKTLDLAKANNTKLVFIRYPATRNYLNSFKDMDTHYKNLLAEVESKGYSYIDIDLRNIYPTSNEYFRDLHHINRNLESDLVKLVEDQILDN